MAESIGIRWRIGSEFAKGYLLQYTQTFAKKNIGPSMLKEFSVSHVAFNYKSNTWATAKFILPALNDTYVLLTPKDLLTKDDTWINKRDVLDQFDSILASVSNEQLRSELSYYFSSNLPKPEKDKKGNEIEPSKHDIVKAQRAVIEKYPVILDYYIKYKEDNGSQAKSISEARVKEIYDLFVGELAPFIQRLSRNTKFYETKGSTLAESYDRVMFLKDVIENKDGYRIFYHNGKPIQKETYLHVMFRLTWYATPDDVTPEANAGRGPVDFKVSRGAFDKSLIEFKLASNTRLSQNLANQVEIYKKAHDTDKAIKVILFFSAQEEDRAKKIISDLGLSKERFVVLIDARQDNKISASKAKQI